MGTLSPPTSVTTDTTFAIVPTWVLDSEVGPVAVRLYAVLARYADASNVAFPSRRTLAARMQCKSRSTVDRAIAELVSVGALTVTHRARDDGQQTSNVYRLHVLPAGLSTGGAANLQPPLPTSETPGAAQNGHGTKAIEREEPLAPAQALGNSLLGHHGQHPRCRACGTSPRAVAAAQKAEAQRRPEWCGGCEEQTRTQEVQIPSSVHSTVRRCPTCHPLEARK